MTDKTGVCKIVAATDNFENDSYGDTAKHRFNEIAKQLSSIYGKTVEFKSLKSGALFKDESEFVMSLLQNERDYIVYWGGDGKDLKDGVTEVALRIRGISRSSSFIKIQYSFMNSSECDEYAKNIDKGSL